MQSVFEALAILSGDDAHVLLTRQFNPALLQWAVAVQSKVRPPQVSKLLSGTADRRKLTALLQSKQNVDGDDEDLGAPAPKDYKTHSNSIVEVLGDMKDKAAGELSE